MRLFNANTHNRLSESPTSPTGIGCIQIIDFIFMFNRDFFFYVFNDEKMSADNYQKQFTANDKLWLL